MSCCSCCGSRPALPPARIRSVANEGIAGQAREAFGGGHVPERQQPVQDAAPALQGRNVQNVGEEGNSTRGAAAIGRQILAPSADSASIPSQKVVVAPHGEAVKSTPRHEDEEAEKDESVTSSTTSLTTVRHRSSVSSHSSAKDGEATGWIFNFGNVSYVFADGRNLRSSVRRASLGKSSSPKNRIFSNSTPAGSGREPSWARGSSVQNKSRANRESGRQDSWTERNSHSKGSARQEHKGAQRKLFNELFGVHSSSSLEEESVPSSARLASGEGLSTNNS